MYTRWLVTWWLTSLSPSSSPSASSSAWLSCLAQATLTNGFSYHSLSQHLHPLHLHTQWKLPNEHETTHKKKVNQLLFSSSQQPRSLSLSLSCASCVFTLSCQSDLLLPERGKSDILIQLVLSFVPSCLLSSTGDFRTFFQFFAANEFNCTLGSFDNRKRRERERERERERDGEPSPESTQLELTWLTVLQ